MKKYIKNKKYVSCDDLARIFTKDYGVKVTMNDIHRLCDPYCRKRKGSLIEINDETFYDTATIYNLRCYGNNAVEFVKKINALRPQEPKQTEDDLEYTPNTDYNSVRSWGYKPKNIQLSEEQYNRLFESVYVNNVKKNKAYLTYDLNKRKHNNLLQQDFLETDKMDEDNSDTYEVKLKGGITSYNITSIKGTEVMHYFKKLWDNQKVTVKLGGKDGEDYEMIMLSNEFNLFKQRFLKKIGFVVNYCINKFKTENKDLNIDKISIYPVKSSSNFNIKMCEEISNENINGLNIHIVNPELFLKDLSKLEKDEDFIKKNIEYYDSPIMRDDNTSSSLIKYVDKDLNRYKSISNASIYIDEMNDCVNNIIDLYYRYNNSLKNGGKLDKIAKTIANEYMKYHDCFAKVNKSTRYIDPTKNYEESAIHFEKIANALKYTKGPSVEKRTQAIWDVIKPLLRGKKCSIDGSPYLNSWDVKPINKWVKTPFQIKNLTNGERMAMRNYYSPNANLDIIKQEVESAKNSIFIIFDDNVSGGATLSDICYQCSKLGIENLIPITFGKMDKKNTLNFMPLTLPKNTQGENDFNY